MNNRPPLTPDSLISLYNDAGVNRLTGLSTTTSTLHARDLVEGYFALLEAAPRRHDIGKVYFTGRTGVTSSGQYSNRREEHLAIALRNAYHGSTSLLLPDGRPLKLLDYQVPLKARRGDTGIGKIDLFGVIAGTISCLIELKVPARGGGRSDTPLRAFLEAFTYCAVFESNIDDLAAEARETFSYSLTQVRPTLM